MYRVAIVVGTRPEVIKLAPVISAISLENDLESVVISTGQQGELLKRTLKEFNIEPDYEFEIGPGEISLPEQYGILVGKIGHILHMSQAQYVITQGDTSSAIAGAVAGFLLRIPVGHVEAGLRSRDLASPFPEEGYRTMISRIATHHFAPTETAIQNLLAEGISRNAIHLVGNTIVDSIRLYSDSVNTRTEFRKILVTLHRRENFGQPLKDIAGAIRDFAKEEIGVRINVIIHPNPNSGLVLQELLSGLANIDLLQPLNYRNLLREIGTSYLVLTDSGGIQEECAVLGTTLLIARNETERPEVLSESRKLIGTSRDKVYDALKVEMGKGFQSTTRQGLNYAILGDGHTSSRICKIIKGSM